jgi:integrase
MDFNPAKDRDPSDVTPLRKARREFLTYKQDTQKDSTARAYKFPTKDFIQYCEGEDITITGDVSIGHINRWMDQRRNEVKPITVRNNAKHLRVFIKWMAGREYLEWGLHNKIEIPTVQEGEDVSQQVLRESRAERVLNYLDTYHYGTRTHAIFYTQWHTGCRISGIIALDLDDFHPSVHDDNILTFRDRPDQGTPLKNGKSGERDVTISDGLAEVLNDYISVPREEKTDEYNRKPLFTVPSGRLYRQRAYKNIVAITRPCVPTGKCPIEREIEDCEAAQVKKKAYSCPESVATHAIRKGSITHHINEG